MKKALITAAKILTFFIGWAVLAGVIEIPSKEPAVWRFFAELIPFAVMIVFTVVFLLIIVLMALFCFLSYKKNKKLRSEAS